MSVIDDAWQRRVDRMCQLVNELEFENRELKAQIVKLETCIREFTKGKE